MSVALRPSMTLAEFLAWEDGQDLRHEFDGFHPVAMTGGTRAHAILQGNLMGALHGRLRGGPCRAFGSDLKVEVAGSIRYPDAFVVCTGGANDSTVVRDPVVIFEVLSPSTAANDRITKNREYAATPSVRRYVMLEQDRIAATVFARIEGEWRGALLTEADTLHLPEIGIALPLAELYEDMDLPPDPDSAARET
ncbi:Uma2 family endonuclease [Paracraurococcus lichenis]|uniref:Uma2 family endonuclease n=1 Tax=Paracraurococcus lichenis TaxID=3064888 RepID=A0ABT9DZV9_9PROT|nr:Uma2 family endonuclease [Paracraurococcus sp. LOR1-02]MDO9709449.1 Uma2 family endonuclease [Paracraurococcus sp. LOR1-02]